MPFAGNFSKGPAAVVSLVAVVVFLGGCTHPYAKSQIDPKDAVFPGITTYWTSAASPDVRVLFVHGMCTHDEAGWVTHGWDARIRAYFKLPTATLSPSPPPSPGEVQIIAYEYRIGSHRLSSRFLVWSELTSKDKKTIRFDNPPPPPGQFTWKRAALNGELKTSLLNDCLSDAVIYAGIHGAEIQNAVRDAICRALDGQPGPAGCDFPQPDSVGRPSVVIVTESLGSRLVFDAITDFAAQAQRRGGAAADAVDAAIAPITEIFMLANQIPLLGLARPPLVPGGIEALVTGIPHGADSMAAALRAISAASGRQQRKGQYLGRTQAVTRPTLIAFSDPNDLLSYRIPPDDVAILGKDANIVNVVTSNSATFFGYVENPLPAHTNVSGVKPSAEVAGESR
jgi:hypothetical protein